MPRKEINDYVFYKIVCLDNSVELCYVGSTANWKARNHSHKSICNNENSNDYNHKIYKTIRENGGWDNFKMVQLGTREQLTKRQAEQIEEQYRVELKANMNGKRCYITEQQKEEYNKDYNKKYKEEHKEELKEHNKEYSKNYYEENKEYYQNYYKENRDKILEYNQKWCEENNEYYQNYYKENRDEINEKKKAKVKCECGCMIRSSDLSRHQKTPKHINLMNQIKTGNENI